MKKSKRHQTNLISLIIVIATSVIIAFLIMCLYKQASLEVRFDAIINWLGKVERAVAGLDTHVEILICIFLVSDVERFSCACWPFVCHLWRNAYSNPLPIFELSSLFCG